MGVKKPGDNRAIAVSGRPFPGTPKGVDLEPGGDSVDQTLKTSVKQVKSSRDLLHEIDERLARGAEVLKGQPSEIDLRDAPGPDDD